MSHSWDRFIESGDWASLLRTVPYILSTEAEKNFSPEYLQNLTADNWWLIIILSVLYVLLVWWGPGIMSSKTAFDIQMPLAIWNGLLCLFSVIGAIKTVPHLSAMLLTMDFESTICTPQKHSWDFGPVGLWVALFNFSKPFELLDTVFIVLRKKPLIFLHYFHHITVMIYCWNAYQKQTATGIYFVAMNYSIHACMYFYYCTRSVTDLSLLSTCVETLTASLRCHTFFDKYSFQAFSHFYLFAGYTIYVYSALGLRLKWFPPFLITVAQIAQMLGGVCVCASACYFRLKRNRNSTEHDQSDSFDCANDNSSLISGVAMYASYLYLFAQFAAQKYSKSGGAKKQDKAL